MLWVQGGAESTSGASPAAIIWLLLCLYAVFARRVLCLVLGGRWLSVSTNGVMLLFLAHALGRHVIYFFLVAGWCCCF